MTVLSLGNGVHSMLSGWEFLICRRAGLWYKCSDTQGNLCMGTNMADSVQVFVFKERREAGMSGNGSSMWSYS